MTGGYIPGDHWIICDVCGFKVRSSTSRKRWDGARVCLKDFEERHPQDGIKGKPDRMLVHDPRPEPADVFLAIGDVSPEDL